MWQSRRWIAKVLDHQLHLVEFHDFNFRSNSFPKSSKKVIEETEKYQTGFRSILVSVQTLFKLKNCAYDSKNNDSVLLLHEEFLGLVSSSIGNEHTLHLYEHADNTENHDISPLDHSKNFTPTPRN